MREEGKKESFVNKLVKGVKDFFKEEEKTPDNWKEGLTPEEVAILDEGQNAFKEEIAKSAKSKQTIASPAKKDKGAEKEPAKAEKVEEKEIEEER